MMETMILALLVASVAVQQVLSQDVSSVNDKNDAEAPTWNNRHQHFTMHFGKRLEPQELPAGLIQASAVSPRAYDLYPVATAAAAEQQRPANAIKFPYWLSIQLERGQTLHAVPPSDDQDAFWPSLPQRMPIYSIERPTVSQTYEFSDMIQQQQPRQQQVNNHHVKQQQLLSGQRLLKLMNGDGNGNEQQQEPTGEKAQPSSNFQEDGGKQQPAINLNTRSPMPNQIKLPKHFIPVLFGAGSNFGSYNKKAEPKDNFFMHFG